MKKLFLPIALTLLASTSASAQANVRQGFWISVGMGAGSAGADCSLCSSDRETALSGYLRLGGTLSRQVLLGVGTNGWVKSQNGVEETIGTLSALALVYPDAHGAFFVQGGLGAMAYVADDGVDEITSVGPSLMLGVGYDFRVASRFSVTAYINAMTAVNAKLKINDLDTGETFSPNVIQIGAAASWH